MNIFSKEKRPNSITVSALTVDNARDYFALMHNNKKYFSNFDNMDAGAYTTVERVREGLKKIGNKTHYGIYENGSLIGSVGVMPDKKNKKTAIIGYLVGEKYRGRGIASSAIEEVIAIEKSKYSSVLAFVHEENIASQRVLEKSGFKKIPVILESVKNHHIYIRSLDNEV